MYIRIFKLCDTIPQSVILGTRSWNGPSSLLHCYMLVVVLIRCCLASHQDVIP